MPDKSMAEKIGDAIHAASVVQIGKFRFDEPCVDMLIVTDENFEDHLTKQAAAIAYYGDLCKEAQRRVVELKRAYEYRYNEMFADCSRILAKTTGKPLAKDVEAMVYSKYQVEVKEWDAKMDTARREADQLEVFYKAWEQKSYSISGVKDMIMSNLMTPESSVSMPGSGAYIRKFNTSSVLDKYRKSHGGG